MNKGRNSGILGLLFFSLGLTRDFGIRVCSKGTQPQHPFQAHPGVTRGTIPTPVKAWGVSALLNCSAQHCLPWWQDSALQGTRCHPTSSSPLLLPTQVALVLLSLSSSYTPSVPEKGQFLRKTKARKRQGRKCGEKPVLCITTHSEKLPPHQSCSDSNFQRKS